MAAGSEAVRLSPRPGLRSTGHSHTGETLSFCATHFCYTCTTYGHVSWWVLTDISFVRDYRGLYSHSNW